MKLIGDARLGRVRPQLLPDTLGAPTPPSAGDDCNVKVTQALIYFASRGATYPSVTDIRKAMGAPLNGGGTSTDQAIKACAKYGVVATRLHTFVELEAALLDPNQMLSVGWDNDYVNTHYPSMSGDLNFDGWHRVGLFGTEQIKLNGAWWVMLHDPTHDGRIRNNKPYPKGPMVVKRSWVEDSMAATGQFICLAVNR